MKKIQLSQGTIRVDEIKDKGFSGYYYLNGEIFNTATTMLQSGCKKIIASEFFIDKDLPMYKEENELEKIAEEYGEFWASNNGSYDEPMSEDEQEEYEEEKTKYSNSFYEGYKAAQSKGCYTELQVRETIEMAWEANSKDGTVDLNVVLCYGNNNDLRTKWTEDEIIQSLKDKPLEFEMKEVLIDRGSDIETTVNIPYTREGYYEIIKTTRDENGQLWCKLK